MPWHHHLVKTTPKQFTKPRHPKLQSFVVTLVKLYIHARTRTPTHPPSKNRQVRVKIIKKMKMLAQVKVNAECLINCVREKIINEEMLFLSFFFSPEGIIERRKRSIRVRNWAACFGRCLCVRLSCHFCVVLEGESDTHAYTSVSLL